MKIVDRDGTEIEEYDQVLLHEDVGTVMGSFGEGKVAEVLYVVKDTRSGPPRVLLKFEDGVRVTVTWSRAAEILEVQDET